MTYPFIAWIILEKKQSFMLPPTLSMKFRSFKMSKEADFHVYFSFEPQYTVPKPCYRAAQAGLQGKERFGGLHATPSCLFPKVCGSA